MLRRRVVCTARLKNARGAALYVWHAAAEPPVHLVRREDSHQALTDCHVIDYPRALRAIRRDRTTAPRCMSWGVQYAPRGRARSGPPRPTSSRHATDPSLAHLVRACASRHADSLSDKPARSTRCPSILRHGAVPLATGRAYQAYRTLAERLSSSNKQQPCCLSISSVSRAELPSAVTPTVMSVRASLAPPMPPRHRASLAEMGRV